MSGGKTRITGTSGEPRPPALSGHTDYRPRSPADAMYIAILSLMTSLELAVGVDYRDAIKPGWLDAGLVAGVATVLSASALIIWAVYKLEKQLRKMSAEE